MNMLNKRQISCILLTLIFLLFGGVISQAADQFVFGVILVGPKNDHGWSQNHYEAGLKVEENIPGSKMLLFESLNTADSPETSLEDVVTEMVAQGAKLIFTTSDEFEEDTDAVAANFPEVVFVNVTGSRVLEGISPSNVGNFDGKMELTEAIAGCAAALTTKNGNIGYLGPLINFETRRLAASAYLGAKYCFTNYRGMEPQKLSFTVTWIGFWFNIPGVTLDPTEEANHFFDSGADVVIGALDTPEAVTVAGQRRSSGEDVYVVGYDNPSACSVAPSACLGVPYYNWGPIYTQTVSEVMSGQWKSGWSWIEPDYSNINNLETSIVGYAKGDGLAPDVSLELDKFIAEVVSYGQNSEEDSLFLWRGPLNLQDGTLLASEGENVKPVQKLADGVSVWYLPQLLEGMVGASQ